MHHQRARATRRPPSRWITSLDLGAERADWPDTGRRSGARYTHSRGQLHLTSARAEAATRQRATTLRIRKLRKPVPGAVSDRCPAGHRPVWASGVGICDASCGISRRSSGTGQIRISEVYSLELSCRDICSTQIRASEICISRVCAPKIRIRNDSVSEIGVCDT